MDITVSKARRINAEAKASGKQFGMVFNQRIGVLFQKAQYRLPRMVADQMVKMRIL